MKTVVIGAGLNGLVAGAWLARQKRDVVILDQRPVAGGAAITTEFAPGFRGPTLSHVLGPIAPEVLSALELGPAGLDAIAPDPPLAALIDERPAVRIFLDPARTADALQPVSANDAARWPEFARAIRAVGDVLARLDRHPPPDIDRPSAADLFRLLGTGRAARRLGRADLGRLFRYLPMAVADLAAEWFESDALQATVCAHALHGHLAGPWSAGTGALLLQRVAADPAPLGSSVTAHGGPGAVTSRIARAATDAGAVLRTGARVRAIETAGGRATAVVLEDGERIAAAEVVAAIDPRQVCLELLDPTALPPSVRERFGHLRARGVTAKINLALDAAPDWPRLDTGREALPGRVIVATGVDGLERAFDAAKRGALPARPWLEATMPSAADPSLAPAGAHVLSIVAHPVPRHLADGAWDAHGDRLAESVLDVLDTASPGIRRHVVAREVLTPEDLERRWGLPGGQITHGEMTLDQWWAARPLLGWARYRLPVAGLVLASAGAHPGGGLTGLPGLLAAKTLIGGKKNT